MKKTFSALQSGGLATQQVILFKDLKNDRRLVEKRDSTMRASESLRLLYMPSVDAN